MTAKTANLKILIDTSDFPNHSEITNDQHDRETWAFTYFLSSEEEKMDTNNFLNNIKYKLDTFLINKNT